MLVCEVVTGGEKGTRPLLRWKWRGILANINNYRPVGARTSHKPELRGFRRNFSESDS